MIQVEGGEGRVSCTEHSRGISHLSPKSVFSRVHSPRTVFSRVHFASFCVSDNCQRQKCFQPRLAVLERWLSKLSHKSSSKASLQQWITSIWLRAILSSKHLFCFLLSTYNWCNRIRFSSALSFRSSTSRHSTSIADQGKPGWDKALVSHSSLELFKGATGLSFPLREYGRADVRPIRGKWKPYVILMKQEAGAHNLLLQEHLLPERNVHLALIVSQPIKWAVTWKANWSIWWETNCLKSTVRGAASARRKICPLSVI